MLNRSFDLRSKILTLGNENKISFYFALRSLIRTFDLRSKVLTFGNEKKKLRLFFRIPLT